MTSFLDFNADTISIDPELIKQVPYALSSYYLALPLAQENGSVSVVMAHPDNQAALLALERLLGATIVPVAGAAGAIQAMLEHVYQPAKKTTARMLAWSELTEWQTAVAEAAAAFSRALGLSLTTPAAPATLADALALARAGEFSLTVLNLSEKSDVMVVLNHSTTPVLLVRGPYTPPRQILVALRGFASDELILDVIAPLVEQNQACVSIMPLAGFSALQPPISNNEGLMPQHLERCLAHLCGSGGHAGLKFRQGQPVEQVVNELHQGDYDLLVIAAEAQGDFVGSVLTAVSERHAHDGRAVFILKPPGLLRR